MLCNIRFRAGGELDKGWVAKNLLFEKIAIALEGERFVLGGCPSHHLLYS